MSTRPRLFKATLLREGERLLAFAEGKAWAREDGRWTLLDPLPPRTQGAFLDPARGVVLVGWDGVAFVRRTWSGEELERLRLPVELKTIDSLAFDPSARTLVVCGGDGGLAPWTLSLDDEGRVVMHEVSLRHVVWDVGRDRVVGLQDCEVGHLSVSSIPPRLGRVVHHLFQPGAPLEGPAVSSLAYDEQRSGVIFFAQPEPGAEPILHVLHGDRCVTEPIEAPPLHHFRLVHDGRSLLAFGGQCFEGNEDSLWRLDGATWHEAP